MVTLRWGKVGRHGRRRSFFSVRGRGFGGGLSGICGVQQVVDGPLFDFLDLVAAAAGFVDSHRRAVDADEDPRVADGPLDGRFRPREARRSDGGRGVRDVSVVQGRENREGAGSFGLGRRREGGGRHFPNRFIHL